jgi:hypothetical protein
MKRFLLLIFIILNFFTCALLYRYKEIILTKEYLLSNGYNSNSTRFNLQYKNIKSIESDAFRPFPFVVKIDLSYNKIEKITNATFNRLFYLLELNLNNNLINFIEKKSFDSLFNIKIVYLNNNQLIELDFKNLFNALISVEELYVSNNRLRSINWDSKILEYMLIFDVHSNLISHISLCNGSFVSFDCPDFNGPFSYQYRLKYFDISKNNLREIEKYDFYLLTQLETLLMNGNSIKMIGSDSFIKNHKLTNLRLDYTNINKVEFAY